MALAKRAFAGVKPVSIVGRVRKVLGTLIEGSVPNASIGEQCDVFHPDRPSQPIRCEVVGFTESSVLLSPLVAIEGISGAYLVRPLRRTHAIVVGAALMGRILDGFGEPLDGLPPLQADGETAFLRQVISEAPPPTDRPRIQEVFATGVRAIDSVLTLGRGQRVGILASPGCGKTTLMAAMARGSDVDAVVLALIGERGREVREFTEHEFDPDLLEKTVLVCATSDRTSIERVRAAFTATAIAEGLRDRGLRVLLMVDSLTRLARAQREIGLAAGEPPARAGFPPSVYAMLPKLIERAGNTGRGSITAVYTVLLDGEIRSDPISEEAVSLLDGHIVLARKLAEQGHYPAVDVLSSISRIMSNVVDRTHMRAAMQLRDVLSKYRDVELLLRLGEYKPGLDAETDRVIECYPRVIGLLRQDTRKSEPIASSVQQLMAIAPA
ncbi:type III secretion protein N (ATPase) [Variovorax boronicumulans]|uniref:FliI/YscN family ATPase n=1 Tax=Variovorax boronicumulans TaxID=436515 RepID=UPI002783D6C7|nr:FliI/YscN family ATPase [Variovorax boronicumulans]MDQ0083800.1 type III secretion protein N (ATPase) [Variovorax boronicumulans]